MGLPRSLNSALDLGEESKEIGEETSTEGLLSRGEAGVEDGAERAPMIGLWIAEAGAEEGGVGASRAGRRGFLPAPITPPGLTGTGLAGLTGPPATLPLLALATPLPCRGLCAGFAPMGSPRGPSRPLAGGGRAEEDVLRGFPDCIGLGWARSGSPALIVGAAARVCAAAAWNSDPVDAARDNEDAGGALWPALSTEGV